MAGTDIDFSRMLDTESGNRQKDRNGVTIRSPKGAVGAAQVMPGTGPEAARLAGVPWDQNRFENDADYNRSLGAAYHAAQLKRFGGDRRAAAAAYNAGPTRVEGLRNKYGSDWEAHLPAETKDYLADVHGAVSGGRAMTRIDPNLALNGTSGVTTDKPGTTLPDGMNPFTAGKAVNKGIEKIAGRAQAADDLLTSVTNELNQVQDSREAALTQAVQQKDAVYSDIQRGTEELQGKVAPIFARRSEIASRKVELANMSPIKREFLGIFNKNYDVDRLDEEDRALAGQAQTASQEYEITTKLADTMLNVITGKQSSHDAVSQLHVANLVQDTELAGQSLSLARAELGDALNGVQAGATLTSAQVQARGSTLSQMTSGDLNTAYSQATKNGGKAVINGVEISAAEITERQRQLTSQALALEGQQLGLQSQRLNYAAARESELISHMSYEDIQGAIKAGGVYHGVTLNQQQLTQALGSSLQRQSLLANQAATSVDNVAYTRAIDGYNQVIQTTLGRVQGITGANVPQVTLGYAKQLALKSREYQEKIHKAAPEAQPMLRAQFLQELGGMVQNMDKVVDKTVQGMTRDPDAQILLGAWAKGNTPTAEQATKGVIALTRGGSLPPGVRLNGPAAAAFRAGQAALKAVDDKYDPSSKANKDAMMRGGLVKPNAKALEAERQTAVSAAMSRAWIGANMQQVMQSAPDAAKAMGHPFGQVNPADWRAAYQAGELAGKERMAQTLGVTPDQVNPKSLTPEQRKQMATIQTSEFLRALDRSPSANGMQVKPSAALVDFYRSPKFQGAISNYSQAAGRSDFGGMAADSVSGSGFGEAFNSYVQQLGNAQGAITLENQATVRQQAQSYAGSPYKRAAVILGAIPGLNKAEEAELLTAVKGQVGVVANVVGGINRGFFGNDGGVGSQQVDSIILNHKFEDPRIEKIRQRAAKDWNTFSEASDRAVDRLHSTSEQ